MTRLSTRLLVSIFTVALLASGAAFAGENSGVIEKPVAKTQSYTGHELAKYAKVSMVHARVIALKNHPGKITDEELEKEKGGSGLRYSFDIDDAGKVYEVGVDAKTGKVLENAPEGKNPD